MVEKFNEYKMAICGEDIHGIYGVGFVEAMSCGCAYIGLDSAAYRDLGMGPGVHYIGYDGTLPDPIEKIAYYKTEEHAEELFEIAQAGLKFAQEVLNKESVGDRMLHEIEEWIEHGGEQ